MGGMQQAMNYPNTGQPSAMNSPRNDDYYGPPMDQGYNGVTLDDIRAEHIQPGAPQYD